MTGQAACLLHLDIVKEDVVIHGFVEKQSPLVDVDKARDAPVGRIVKALPRVVALRTTAVLPHGLRHILQHVVRNLKDSREDIKAYSRNP